MKTISSLSSITITFVSCLNSAPCFALSQSSECLLNHVSHHQAEAIEVAGFSLDSVLRPAERVLDTIEREHQRREQRDARE